MLNAKISSYDSDVDSQNNEVEDEDEDLILEEEIVLKVSVEDILNKSTPYDKLGIDSLCQW